MTLLEIDTTLDFHNLTQSLPIGLVVLNSQGTIEYANPLALEWLVCEVGQSWSQCLASSIDSSSTDIKLNNGPTVSLETNPLVSKGGQVVAIIPKELSNTASKENHSNRLQQLGNMCANLAHQIRNPLFSALLKTDQLINKYEDEKKLKQLKISLKGIEQEINSILLFSKSDEKIIERVSIEDVLSQAIGQVNIEAKSIMIDFDVKLYSNAQVIANPQALIGVFANLISNAVDASIEMGQIKIEMTETDHFTIVIQDRGQGIPSGDLHRIFEPFYTTKTYGTGLGLSIARQIIESHGGQISISSIINQGTQIHVQLPKG